MKGYLKEYFLKDIAKINVGKDLIENSFSKEKTIKHKYPVYSNTVENKGLYGFYDFEEYPSNSLTIVGRGAGLGTAFPRMEGFGAIGRLLILKPINDRFDVRYLSEYINNKLRIFNESGGIPQLPGDSIGKYRVPLPPLPEQKAIADILSTWDEAIEKTEKLIKEKEKRFKGLLSSLIKEKDGWKKLKLGDICEIKKGTQLNVENMKNDGVYYALNGGIELSGRTDNWNTEANTITISEGGNSCGYVNFNRERFWAGGHCYSLLNIKNNTYTIYLFYYLKMNESKIMNLRVGSGLPNIQKKDIDKFQIILPSLNEQQRIAETLNTAQDEINILKKLSEKYKKQKQGLMQKLLTGEWRVRNV